MIKNGAIALLSTALVFTNTVLAGYGTLAYLAVSAVAFAVVCEIEDMWEKHMNRVRKLKRFKEVQKNISTPPTKAS